MTEELRLDEGVALLLELADLLVGAACELNGRLEVSGYSEAH